MSINKRNKQEHTEISLKKYTNILKTSNKKKTKIVVFFSRKFSWIGLHSHRHTDQSSPTLSIGPIRPPRICYPTLMDLGSMSSTSQVDL